MYIHERVSERIPAAARNPKGINRAAALAACPFRFASVFLCHFRKWNSWACPWRDLGGQAKVGGRAQLLNRAAALAACPFRFASRFSFPEMVPEWACPWRILGGCAKGYGRVAARGGGLKKSCALPPTHLKTLFLLDTSVNSQKKLASRLDEMTGRCLTLERNQCFF